MKEILDLHFLLKNLNLDDDLISAIEQMHKKVADTSENKFLFVIQQISRVSRIIKRDLGGNAILSMIQYAKSDPDFQDKTNPKFPHIITNFIERQETRFSADTKKLLMVFQEDKIDTMITNAFGDRKFFSFAGYNDQVSARLQKSTSLSFDWVKPMELLRTFTRESFDVSIGNFLKNILVEGFFIDNLFQQNLGAAFYYCENLSDKFEDFERLFTDGEKCSLIEINGYLDEIEKGGNFEKPLSKLVYEANTAAKDIVQDGAEQYTALYKNCSLLLADSKKRNPELVSNIKVLFSSIKLRSLVLVFDREIQKLNSFLEIMKNYAILAKKDIS